jgi:hypothetical protein
MNLTQKTAVAAASMILAASAALPAFAQELNVSGQAGAGDDQNDGPSIQARFNGQVGMPPAPGYNNRGEGDNNGRPGMMGRPMMAPGVVGTVSAISGTTITLTGRTGFGSTTATTTYTVDASSATVLKNNATSTVSSIAVGDRIFVQGTVSGSSVTAKTIFDGAGWMMGRGDRNGRPGMMGSSTSPFTGNGQPVIAGTVSAINGSSLTVTTAASTTYTVDASNAKILQGPNMVALSTITVGSHVVIQGAVSGSSVTASTVIEQGARGMMGSQQGNDNGQGKDQGQHTGFFQGIGNFFKHLFGF